MDKRYRIRFEYSNGYSDFSQLYTKEQIEEYKRKYMDNDLKGCKRIKICEKGKTYPIETFLGK